MQRGSRLRLQPSSLSSLLTYSMGHTHANTHRAPPCAPLAVLHSVFILQPPPPPPFPSPFLSPSCLPAFRSSRLNDTAESQGRGQQVDSCRPTCYHKSRVTLTASPPVSISNIYSGRDEQTLPARGDLKYWKQKKKITDNKQYSSANMVLLIVLHENRKICRLWPHTSPPRLCQNQ